MSDHHELHKGWGGGKVKPVVRVTVLDDTQPAPVCNFKEIYLTNGAEILKVTHCELVAEKGSPHNRPKVKKQKHHGGIRRVLLQRILKIASCDPQTVHMGSKTTQMKPQTSQRHRATLCNLYYMWCPDGVAGRCVSTHEERRLTRCTRTSHKGTTTCDEAGRTFGKRVRKRVVRT